MPKVKAAAEPRGYKEWFLTWNNPPDADGSALLRLCKDTDAKGWAFQLEEGDSKTPHYQGAIEWRNQMRMSTIVKRCKGIHVERALEHHTPYGTKEEGRLAGPWIKCWDQPRAVYDVLKTAEWKPWQIELKKTLDQEPDDRHILWYWEETGGAGKSAFAKHYCLEGNALCATGKANNVKAAIAKWFENDTGDLRYVFYCVPRAASLEDTMDYAALEQIKDGCFFSGKYESGQVLFPNVHLVVFANFEPSTGMLSGDRLVVTHI